MKKIFLFIIIFILSLNVKALPLPVDVTADAVVLLNLDTDQIIYEKNPDKQEILASLTKIMTAYTIIENIPDLEKKVTITNNDLANLYGFTCAGLQVGDKVSYLDLLYATILHSGADSSQALALHTSGSNKKFVELMNKEAKKLGLRNTNFADSYGGDDNNISTAREMSILLKEALKKPTFKKVFTTTTKTLSNGLQVTNYSRTIATFHGLDSNLIIGNKSGYTPEAGLLLASTATINNTNYALIIMKSQENAYLSTHILDTYKVYDYIKTLKFNEKILLEKGSYLKTIPVEGGTIKEYIIQVDKDIKANLTEEEFKKIKYEYKIADKLTPENKKGDNLGFIDIKIEDTIIDRYDIYLKEDILSHQKKSKITILLIVALVFLIIILFCTNFFGFKIIKIKK